MDRRSFLRFLGLAPALPIAAKLAEPKPVDVAKFAEPLKGEVLRTTSASSAQWGPIDLGASSPNDVLRWNGSVWEPMPLKLT